MTLLSLSCETTESWAASFAATILKSGDCLCLQGPLGSGKTTWVRGLAQGWQIPATVNVHSPTFALVHHYRGPASVLYHFDLYRLNHLRELDDLAFNDYVTGEIDPIAAQDAMHKRLVVVEWADRFKLSGQQLPLSPDSTFWLQLDYDPMDASRRTVTFLQVPAVREAAVKSWCQKVGQKSS